MSHQSGIARQKRCLAWRQGLRRAKRLNIFRDPLTQAQRLPREDLLDGIQRKIAECTHAPLEKLILSLLDGMVEIHAKDSRLAALLQSEVPHRAGGTAEFSARLSDPLLAALAPHAKSLSRRSDLRTRVFVMAEILDALGHSIVLRRPQRLSLEAARHEASTAMLAYLTL